MSEKKSFWSTLPGLATGTATVITAALGVWGIVRANNEPPAPQDQSSSAGVSSSSPNGDHGSNSTSTSNSNGRASARLAPDTLKFGKQGIGRSSANMILTLTNVGSEELTVEAIDLGGADASQFEIAEDECNGEVVAPTSHCEISVRFSPKSVGEAQAKLTVKHDGEDSPSDASLRGEGVVLQI